MHDRHFLFGLQQEVRIQGGAALTLTQRASTAQAVPGVRVMGEGETTLFFQELAGSLALRHLERRSPALHSR